MTDMERESRSDGLSLSFNTARMTVGDIGEAAVLERVIFSDYWSEESLSCGFSTPAQQYYCARDQKGEMAGYAAVMTVLDEGELLRIGVLEKFRGQGAASALIGEIFRMAAEKNLAFMTLEVRRGNTPAVKLYEKYGFIAEGIRKDYYRNPKEDALIMRKVFDVP